MDCNMLSTQLGLVTMILKASQSTWFCDFLYQTSVEKLINKYKECIKGMSFNNNDRVPER